MSGQLGESAVRMPMRQRDSIFDRVFRMTLSVADRRPGLSILLFHRVLDVADPFRPGDLTASQFTTVAGMLARNFCALSLEEGIERLRRNALPRAAVSITFDDGYRDNVEVAAPILAAHGLTATFFIATGFLNGGSMFNDRIIEACKRTSRASTTLPAAGFETISLGTVQHRVAAAHAIIGKAKYLPFDQRTALVAQLEEQLGVRPDGGPMLDSEGLRRLRSMGMTIGAHTVTHPILARVDDTKAYAEIHESRAHLVEVLREPVRVFAYPNGRPGQDYGTNHVRMVVDAGYASAVCTSPETA